MTAKNDLQEQIESLEPRLVCHLGDLNTKKTVFQIPSSVSYTYSLQGQCIIAIAASVAQVSVRRRSRSDHLCSSVLLGFLRKSCLKLDGACESSYRGLMKSIDIHGVQEVLRNSHTGEAGSTNSHGDSQLEVDKAADTLIFGKLQECGAVEIASSEETSDMVSMGGQGFSVRPISLLVFDVLKSFSHSAVFAVC